MNEQVYAAFPDAMMIAEESTAWPMVSRPAYLGGLGFGFKWNMGWMHDMLDYMSQDPVFRSYHHNKITFSLLYAFTENFILPFSHDEVVYGKGSMIGKMPGDEWQKFANLRLLYGFMFGHPGKKLLFMGGEFGQWSEWNHDTSLDWHSLQYPFHSGLLRWVRDLNTFYRGQPSLFEVDFDSAGFEWVDCNDSQRSVICFLRKGKNPGGHDAVRLQFHAGSAAQLSRRRTSGLPLAGGAEQRRSTLRRQRPGKHRRRDGYASADPRPAVLVEPDAPSAGRGGFPARMGCRRP